MSKKVEVKRIFSDAEEKFQKTVVLYGKSTFLWYDKAGSVNKVPYEEAVNLLTKGNVIIIDTDVAYFPLLFKKNSQAIEVICSNESGNGVKSYKSENKVG